MIILVYDTCLYNKKKCYSMSETGQNNATQGEATPMSYTP